MIISAKKKVFQARPKKHEIKIFLFASRIMSLIGHKRINKKKFTPPKSNLDVELLKLKSKEIQLDNQVVYKKLSSEFVQPDLSSNV